jgi:hypothetical protein
LSGGGPGEAEEKHETATPRPNSAGGDGAAVGAPGLGAGFFCVVPSAFQ